MLDIYKNLCKNGYFKNNYNNYNNFVKIFGNINQLNLNKINKSVLSKINNKYYTDLEEFSKFYNSLGFFDKIIGKNKKKYKEYNQYFYNIFGVKKAKELLNCLSCLRLSIRTLEIENIDRDMFFITLNYFIAKDIKITQMKEIDNIQNIIYFINKYVNGTSSNDLFEDETISYLYNINNVEELIDKLEEIKDNLLSFFDKDIDKLTLKYFTNSVLYFKYKDIKENIILKLKELFIDYKIKCKIINSFTKNIINYKEEVFLIKNYDYKKYEREVSNIEFLLLNNKRELEKISNEFINFKHIKLFKHKNNIEQNIKKILYKKLIVNIVNLQSVLKRSKLLKFMKSLLKNKVDANILQNNILNSFFCIIASLRDYASIIPLKKDLFDLVIIDEASQVNIAQAFPSLIRGKKVLILGDKNQFSNIKSSMASLRINEEYFGKIRDSFKGECNNNKCEIFNIRNSVLDFIEDSSPDFSISLKTHFRGYAELISYSNKFFYNNNLQTLKIRKKPINEIIKFEILDNDENEEENINRKECEFIIKKIEEYLKEGKNVVLV